MSEPTAEDTTRIEIVPMNSLIESYVVQAVSPTLRPKDNTQANRDAMDRAIARLQEIRGMDLMDDDYKLDTTFTVRVMQSTDHTIWLLQADEMPGLIGISHTLTIGEVRRMLYQTEQAHKNGLLAPSDRDLSALITIAEARETQKRNE